MLLEYYALCTYRSYRGGASEGRWFDYGEYFLYEHSLLIERNEADYLPKIRDFTLKIVGNNREADELAAAIGSDFRRRFVLARRNLDKGAIAFCIFVNGEVAHIGFVAMSEEAKNTVDHMPYKVDFSNNEKTVNKISWRTKQFTNKKDIKDYKHPAFPYGNFIVMANDIKEHWCNKHDGQGKGKNTCRNN